MDPFLVHVPTFALARRGVLIAAAIVLPCCGGRTDSADIGVITIADVSVVNVTGNEILPHRSLVIRDGRIDGIYEAGREPGTAGIVVDGSGRFVAPGLIDAHAHIHVRSDLERYLVHGVTTVREMWGLPISLRWQDAVRSRAIAGPNLVVASTFFWMDGPAGTRHVEPKDPETARALVRQAAADGYDLIKIVRISDIAVLEAIIDEARATGLPVSGHYPDRSLPADRMLATGMRSFEHMDEFASIVFANDTSIESMRVVARTLRDRDIGLTTILAPTRTYLEIDRRGAAFYTPAERIAILERMGAFYSQDAAQTVDNVIAAKGEYVEQWTRGTALALKTAATFVEEGVQVAVGTEGIGPFFAVDGVGVHDELELLAEAGLSNRQILTIATVNGAGLLGFEGRKGKVEAGYDADLLLLDANPLDDLATLHSPAAVLVMGRYYSHADLEALVRIY